MRQGYIRYVMGCVVLGMLGAGVYAVLGAYVPGSTCQQGRDFVPGSWCGARFEPGQAALGVMMIAASVGLIWLKIKAPRG